MIKIKDPYGSQTSGILKWENQLVLYKILTPQCNNAQLYFVAHNIDQGFVLPFIKLVWFFKIVSSSWKKTKLSSFYYWV
jgi:hypothetical protein